jgi:flagellar biosynthesis protein FlhG
MNRRGGRTGTLAGLAAPERLVGAPRIWAVGGGKGGVGKSLVASSLACAIAGTGRRCALIDADLGGANLHTLLGIAPPRRTLSHFLSGDVKSLADLMVPTSVPNLSLVSANKALLEMANPKHCQKEKLFRHVRGLDVDEVLLDLGGGSAFNVLDSFLVARRGIVVVTPEPTAIENAEHFLRAAFYRSLRSVTRRPEVKAAILRVKENRSAPPVGSAQELISRVKKIDPPAAKLLAECAQAFAPLLLVNEVENLEDRRVGPALAARCRERLGVSIDYAGCLEADPSVREAVARKRPAPQLFSRSSFTREIEALARRLLREEWEAPDERVDPLTSRSGRARSNRGGAPVSQDSVVPAASLPTLDLERPGAYLRRCRRHLGLTLREMTERTRIQGLGAIEREHFESLPPEPYLGGFLLSYARELGIPELEALTASYLDRYRSLERT